MPLDHPLPVPAARRSFQGTGAAGLNQFPGDAVGSACREENWARIFFGFERAAARYASMPDAKGAVRVRWQLPAPPGHRSMNRLRSSCLLPTWMVDRWITSLTLSPPPWTAGINARLLLSFKLSLAGRAARTAGCRSTLSAQPPSFIIVFAGLGPLPNGEPRAGLPLTVPLLRTGSKVRSSSRTQRCRMPLLSLLTSRKRRMSSESTSGRVFAGRSEAGCRLQRP